MVLINTANNTSVKNTESLYIENFLNTVILNPEFCFFQLL